MSRRHTDMLGNPIAAGDIIVYPTATGSSSAEQNLAQVDEVINLVPKPGTWNSTGLRSRVPYVREDQRHKAGATEYYPSVYDYAKREWVDDHGKHYVLRVRARDINGWGAKTKFLKNVDRVVVVTPLYRSV